MTGSTIGIIALATLAVIGLALWAWRSSGRRVPSDETLRHPRPEAPEPLIRPESRHHDTPAGADLDTLGGREHRT